MRSRTVLVQGAVLMLVLAQGTGATPPLFPEGSPSPSNQCPVREPGAAEPTLQGPITVGEEVRLTLKSPAFAGPVDARRSQPTWSHELHDRGASYIAPHFSHFNLPVGSYLVVRSPDGSRRWEYRGYGKEDLGLSDGFWGIHIAGDRALIELYAAGLLPAEAVVIDGYARGFPEAPDAEAIESICGVDNSREAKCYQSSEPTAYSRSRSVARLLISGTGLCTGWLVGSAGHVLTNNHCIGSASSALNTNYEFMAEGASCTVNCASSLACPGTVVATSGTLIKGSLSLDYSLIRLPTNPTGTYGFLKLRGLGASVNERMYIAGHPAGWGKRISLQSDNPNDQSGFCEVFSTSSSRVHYFCDTQGGSSGSPVLGYADHAVIALHGYAGCPNSGIPSQRLITDLGSSLPPHSVAGPGSCVSNATTLCLQNNRFRVQLTINGQSGQAIPYSFEGGFFWAFGPGNVEVGVKVLDGQGTNGKWWVFHGSLTTLPYTLTITDTLVGTVKTYSKASGSMCGGADIDAFVGIRAPFAGGVLDLPAEAEADGGHLAAACTPSSTAVCLLNNRFRVQVKRSGVAQPAVAVTTDSGSFWFFAPSNPEVVVKVLDGTGWNGRYWVFFGSLTNQSYQVTVTDTATGAVKNYNPPAAHCGTADTEAF